MFRNVCQCLIFFAGVFTPIQYPLFIDEDWFVDGGLLCNYPIHCFDGEPTFSMTWFVCAVFDMCVWYVITQFLAWRWANWQLIVILLLYVQLGLLLFVVYDVLAWRHCHFHAIFACPYVLRFPGLNQRLLRNCPKGNSTG